MIVIFSSFLTITSTCLLLFIAKAANHDHKLATYPSLIIQEDKKSSPPQKHIVPVYSRRNPNAPPVDYGIGHPFDKMTTVATDKNLHHPSSKDTKDRNHHKPRKGGFINNYDHNNHRNLVANYQSDWYDPHFSPNDYLSMDWYPSTDEDTYDPNDPMTLPRDELFPLPSKEQRFDWSNYRPIRIRADFRRLQFDNQDQARKNEFLEFTVLPVAIQFWTKALMVFPVQRLFVDTAACTSASSADFWYGVTNVDLMLYVDAQDSCSSESQGFEALAGARSCDYDQYDRPIAGVIRFCYDSFQLEGGVGGSTEIIDQTTRIMIETSIHEIGHVLGLASADYAFYWDHTTAQPRTPRPIEPSLDVHCINGQYSHELKDRDIYKPSHNTLRMVLRADGVRYYEVVTPTVKRVARNHYNCERMEGMRLENQPTSNDCFGEHWEERIAWDESMSAVLSTSSLREHLSPFTLALLEDSGWYRANFSMAKTISFGHGAGCNFVFEPCIQNNIIPKYSREYFCNSTDKATVFSCDPSQSIIATCDLYDRRQEDQAHIPDIYQYFKESSLRPKFELADYCSMYIDPVINCQTSLPDRFEKHRISGETFGTNSRCVRSDYLRPLCLEISCDKEDSEKNAVTVVLENGDKIQCLEGEMINVTNNISIECPRKATVCPDEVCPADCSGRGVCQWNSTTTPYCECFNAHSTSKSCNDYEFDFLKENSIIDSNNQPPNNRSENTSSDDGVKPNADDLNKEDIPESNVSQNVQKFKRGGVVVFVPLLLFVTSLLSFQIVTL